MTVKELAKEIKADFEAKERMYICLGNADRKRTLLKYFYLKKVIGDLTEYHTPQGTAIYKGDKFETLISNK